MAKSLASGFDLFAHDFQSNARARKLAQSSCITAALLLRCAGPVTQATERTELLYRLEAKELQAAVVQSSRTNSNIDSLASGLAALDVGTQQVGLLPTV